MLRSPLEMPSGSQAPVFAGIVNHSALRRLDMNRFRQLLDRALNSTERRSSGHMIYSRMRLPDLIARPFGLRAVPASRPLCSNGFLEGVDQLSKVSHFQLAATCEAIKL